MKNSDFSTAINFRSSNLLQHCLKACFLFLFGILMLSACNNDKKQIDALAKETETIHDEAMKDMAEMNRIARELKATMTVALMTPEQSAVFNDVLTRMGNAENDMLEWMKNFKSTDDLGAADALKYYQEQKASIQKNHAEIKAATEAGKKLQTK